MRFLPSLIRLAGEGEWTGSGLARQCVVARSCAVEVVLGLPDRMVGYLVRGSTIFFACGLRWGLVYSVKAYSMSIHSTRKRMGARDGVSRSSVRVWALSSLRIDPEILFSVRDTDKLGR